MYFFKNTVGNWIIGYTPDNIISKEPSRLLIHTSTNISVVTVGDGTVLIPPMEITDIKKNAEGDFYANYAEFVEGVSGFFVNAPLGGGVEIVNDLTTGGTTKALSAEQGMVLYLSKLASSGSSYLYVSGIGNPTDNAAELQAAYDEAKKMPRFLGFLDPSSTRYMYAGQTFGTYIDGFKYHKVLADGQYLPLQMAGSIIVTAEEAKSTRTTVIVVPGEYNFGAAAFVADAWGIDIVSLTGNPDVIINSTEETSSGYLYGIKVTADNVLIKGINCKTNTFYIADNLDDLICEYCTGGYGSFAHNGGIASGTFNYCIAGGGSFGGYGTASGTFNNCIADDNSFGTQGNASGTFNNCKGGDNSFGTYGGIISGTFNHCIGGDNSFGTYYGTINETARLYYTRITSGTFPTPITGGRLILCIDGDNNIITI